LSGFNWAACINPVANSATDRHILDRCGQSQFVPHEHGFSSSFPEVLKQVEDHTDYNFRVAGLVKVRLLGVLPTERNN
jgi:hypothetical protein